MTAQIGEKLQYQGRQVRMCSEPLADYFALAESWPDFAYNSTALWRGYVGTWEIRDDRLYLIALLGLLSDGSETTLATIFPDFPDRVFAHWYSGTLRIPEGKQLKYVHMGYGSTYERDFFIDIDKGVVQGTREVVNGESASPSGSEGYSVGAMTVFPTQKRGEEEA